MEMNTKEWKEKLYYRPKNVYDVLTDEQRFDLQSYAKGYMSFIDSAKTEREAVKISVAMAKEHGYRPYTYGMAVEVGGKYYYNNRGKAVYFFHIGREPLDRGMRITAAHIDSPRIDLKQNPLYEADGMGFFKTHYYGGIKKYQWTTIPLALHGIVIRADGSELEITLGEAEDEPVFYINDLLPHLASAQMQKTLGAAIPGESLNLLIGSAPDGDKDADDRVKLQLAKLLYQKYGITETDFQSAELCAVPAFRARNIGFDESMIGAYGHDDRVCAYPALTALLDTKDPAYTAMVILADKEETGSNGVTGMISNAAYDLIRELANTLGANESLVRANSKCLSADVNAAFDPNFAEVYEKKNSSFINRGVVVTKFTGARGKSGTSDASAEYVGFVRSLLDKAGVVWQTGELGKVDEGGGGTVARYIAEKNIDTIDIGVPVISMHAPYEVISKADLYMTYLACKAFHA